MTNEEIDRLVAKTFPELISSYCCDCQATHSGFEPQFKPSTDIRYAMQIHGSEVSIDTMRAVETGWRVICFSDTGSSMVIHELLPMAICLAALKAKGVELPT